MRQRRALVVHTRMPAFDRDSGSQDIDNFVRFLLDAGWQVTFLAKEDSASVERRHAERLRRAGVATYAGFGWAERILRSSDFDVAIVAFWELASAIVPVIRSCSPSTRVVVSSMDVHFLRNARRAFGAATPLGRSYGEETVRELNSYDAADAVLAVSDKERALLSDLLGENHVFTVPLAEDVARSPVALSERRGGYFVGNFRHLPNVEAVEHLCQEVVPLLDPDLLRRHPITILGNWLDRVTLDVDPDLPGVRLVGWVPTIEPYLQQSRLAVVPLLHGAGVKRKVLQSMMAGTPVVTTKVGSEGLDLVQGEHALVAADAADMAAAITAVLTDDGMWHRLATSGAAHVEARHGIEVVRRQFHEVLETVMSRPAAGDGTHRREAAASGNVAALVRARIQSVAAPGSVVLVASGGDDALVDMVSHNCWHFPYGRDGGWAGFEPVDGRAAVTHLEALRLRGAAYFALPHRSFGWRHRFPALHQHLEEHHRRIHADEHLVVYDLSGPAVPADPVPAVRVDVIGTHASERTGPSPALVSELFGGAALSVAQRWSSATGAAPSMPTDTDAAYVVFVRDDAILPKGFLDELVATQVALGADRVQPAHTSGPSWGPPVTERQLGAVAREIPAVTALPVLSVRAGAPLDGAVAILDEVTVGLRAPLSGEGDADTCVQRLWVRNEAGEPVPVERPEPDRTPRISVLISTYNRGALLRECLLSFAKQTLDRSEYEVVVVDDGSAEPVVDALVEELGEELQVFGVRIAHAGRSAAKNHAVLLARAPIVLLFDDDDRAAPDYLEAHLRGHDRKPDEGVAILGHTDWAPELDLTPLMHYVTDVDRLLFAYERLGDGQELDWRGFWEGRISCKRSLLLRRGLHDQRLAYSIDIELGWRLAPHGLRILYDASARSVMARPLDLAAFCDRTEAKGRAEAVIADLHRDSAMARQLKVDRAVALWEERRHTVADLRRRVTELERRAAQDDSVLSTLHSSYRELLRLLHAKGAGGGTGGEDLVSTGPPSTVQPFPNTDPALLYDGTPAGRDEDPVISISIPVWSRTPQLAAMAQETIERLWEVARLPTEVIAVDNGSPVEVPLAARVHRYPENKGVATGWNTGIRLSRAPVVVVLNSDCRVEPGWDEALYEAVTDGRRIAFPYTDHCDGAGFSRPDQGGTAGWCFMMTKAIYDEVGVFDEWFNPAFLEDTDYWHRAWELGIELTPVPAARVVHARRTTASTHPRVDWLLQGHRYKYGWKHGVDPHRAPPYYDREIVEYVGSRSDDERP